MHNDDIDAQRAAWQHRGQTRPPFAIKPGPQQESVWDYPRPPAYVPDSRAVTIHAHGVLIAQSDHSIRVVETGSPPAFYLPPEAMQADQLRPSSHTTFCEWKGYANYFDVITPAGVIEAAIWVYREPSPEAAAIAGWYSAYPEHLDCRVGDEAVKAQEGRYYGGWVTHELVGPWKGAPGTGHW